MRRTPAEPSEPVEPAPPLSHAIKGRHTPRTFPYLSLAPTAARIT